MKKHGRRIAVLGGNNAGKTVFITSLIDNLQNDKPGKPLLGEEWSIVDAKITNAEAVAGLSRFPQEEYRNALAEDAKWPAKTLAASVACLKVRLRRKQKKWYRNDQVVRKLEIVDIAGERTADFGMVNRNYRQWSAMMTNQLSKEGIDWPARFEQVMLPEHEEKSILAAYRTVLVELYKSGANTSITPSTARITIDGKCLDGLPKEYEQKLREHPIGLEENEFAPLPEIAFKGDNYQELIQKFEAAYNKYKKEIVNPIWSWLKGADDVVYLVDVLGILADGVAAYDAEQALAGSCFSSVIANDWRNEDSLRRKGMGWIKAMWSGMHFERLVVVATKADLACNEMRETMKNLAEKLLEKIVSNSCFDKTDYLYCAAICVEDPVQSVRIPEEWDESWDAGKYKFDDKKPPAKKCRKDVALKNLQLGKIVKIILNIE